MLDFFLPEGARGEAMVTTPTEDGLLRLEIPLILTSQKSSWER